MFTKVFLVLPYWEKHTQKKLGWDWCNLLTLWYQGLSLSSRLCYHTVGLVNLNGHRPSTPPFSLFTTLTQHKNTIFSLPTARFRFRIRHKHPKKDWCLHAEDVAVQIVLVLITSLKCIYNASFKMYIYMQPRFWKKAVFLL